ncbi:Polyisoprenoid-binding protein YceI [Filimonas lacunae]|uniref:Polyisoprenoid-binding protein YceI n=1 Tax=Filimonas lacunae TaxID=477680 RepID=A0A173MGC6_9BACT|nr:YceI family protein [Filimonas lacunae]BAV06645.1 rhodanese-like domain protein [Filimonas lacunae]SIT27736.1 Polyisoprenoid-binding protein YceI [Filimonas lacunae]
MYKIMGLSAFVLLAGFAALKASHTTCVTPPDKTSVTLPHFGWEAASWRLVPVGSNIEWKASYITGGGHQGTLQLKEGNLQTGTLNLITNGRFVIDINTIHSTDQPEAEKRKELDAHLLSNDFLAATQFPYAYFTVTGSSYYTPARVQGTLNLKGVSQPIDIPFTYQMQHDTLLLQAVIHIDRTKWGITYQSDDPLRGLKNGMIANNIELILHMRFSKAQDGC